MIQKAIEKIRQERKESKGLGRAANVMAGPVADALCSFCEQDAEFAQAVVQGGPFSDCMKAVEKNCGNALSDLEAYRRAVQFYFPGAAIHMTMTIDLIGDAAHPAPQKAKEAGSVVLNLFDFL